MRVKYLILGAGPTGLGAAWRLNELGESDWLLLERERDAGGLAGSIIDEEGYTWDQGGHIQFSHYEYFDDLMDTLLAPGEWIEHERESWVWIRDRFVPYPFQNNLRYLPEKEMWECVRALIRLYMNPPEGKPQNFDQWIRHTLGDGIHRVFMEPYNFKVWGWPLDEMSADWIGDRVAVTDVKRAIDNILNARDDVAWGPNNTFRFPARGGTGEVWRRAAVRLPQENLRFGCNITRIDAARRLVESPGLPEPVEYENLISTIPLDMLVNLSDLSDEPKFSRAARRLRHSSTHVVGLGIRGAPRDEIATKCWMYFPEFYCPFYRVTVFSNYSPHNVPDIQAGFSLMAEVSETPMKPVRMGGVVQSVIRGALETDLIQSADDVIHTFHRRLAYGYPTPSRERDDALDFLLPELARRGIYSRGRFGAWKYEVSNQDHSLMQGVECVDHLVKGKEETTLWKPNVVNARRPRVAQQAKT